MKKFTFVGCSFTAGEGLALEKSDFDNYTNLISKKYNAGVNNLAVGGNSNYNIFITALNELLFEPPSDKLFVQWSGLNRLWLYPGPDTKLFLSYTVASDYSYRGMVYSKKQLQEFTNIYHILNHDYNNLITLINYCNILSKISNNRVIFINGLLPWTPEILDKNTVTNFSDILSNYSKELLEFKTRDDEELIVLFNKLNSAVSNLNQTQWVNMFDSMAVKLIDTGNDNAHPGPRSHRLYAEMIIKYLEDKND